MRHLNPRLDGEGIALPSGGAGHRSSRRVTSRRAPATRRKAPAPAVRAPEPPPASTVTMDEEAAAMLRVRNGDHAAFEPLYRKYQPALSNFAMRYVDNPTRAEELAQDALLQIFRARASYEPRARFSTYAHRVMINLCLNERRRNSRSPRMEPLLGPDAGEDERGIRELADESQTQIEHRIEAATQLRRVKARLESLPAKPRKALLMSRVYGYSCEEIAREVNISPSAVKSLVFRVTRKLREATSV